MNATTEEIIELALALPSDARAMLAERLVESLDSLEDDRLHKLWAAEAMRRLEEVRSGSVATISMEDALAQVRESIAR